MASPVKAADANHQYGVILTYRNCVPTGNPFTVSTGTIANTAATTLTASPVTTTETDQQVVVVYSSATSSASAWMSATTNANLRGVQERFDAGTISGNGGGLAVADGLLQPATTSGSTVATVTSTASAMMTIGMRGVGTAPTVVLNSPSDGATVSSTPTLDFTGTDQQGDPIRYEVQIFTYIPSS